MTMRSIERLALVVALVMVRSVHSWTTAVIASSKTQSSLFTFLHLASDDWSSFSALQDDDDIVFGAKPDRTAYAVENDDDDVKAAVGASVQGPDVLDRHVDPISVPAGSQLGLDEDTVLGVLAACRDEVQTMFGYTAENRGVGITGGVDFVALDGPTVILSLKGRFWHERTTVLARVANYLQQRIPEIVEVTVQDPWQLTAEANYE
jgi:hypothetical protein